MIAGIACLRRDGGLGDRLEEMKQHSYLVAGRVLVNEFIALTVVGQTAEIDGNVSVGIMGRLDWVGCRYAENATNNTDAKRVAELYLKKGISFVSELKGKFCIVIYDHAKRCTFLVVDRMGLQNLFYSVQGDYIVFATRADILVSSALVPQEISPQGIFNYIYHHASPSPGSIYKNVFKLRNAHYVCFSESGARSELYWQPEFSESVGGSVASLSEEMMSLIENSVRKNVGESVTGAFLSGGLDSSTVSGFLSKISSSKVKTFSIGFDAKGYDEMEYARLASSHFATEAVEYYVTPEDVVAEVPKIAAYFDEPFGNSSALPTYFCAKLAHSSGIDRLLAGDGGDEIFAGNERYAKQTVFERYSQLPQGLRHMLLEPLIFKTPLLGNISIIGKARNYIARSNTPLPDRLEAYNFLHRHMASTIFTREFLEEIDELAPLNNLRETYHQPKSATSLNRMLWLDWKRTLHDNDLVKVNRMCELAGVEVMYPLLDDELVEFSCRVPSNMKLHGNKLRWMYKEGVKGFLPERIINKSKHGFGLPFGVWTAEHKGLQELAYSALASLKGRGIFQETFIDETIKMHQNVHAGFYGELVWVLMMLELWLEKS